MSEPNGKALQRDGPTAKPTSSEGNRLLAGGEPIETRPTVVTPGSRRRSNSYRHAEKERFPLSGSAALDSADYTPDPLSRKRFLPAARPLSAEYTRRAKPSWPLRWQ